MQNINRTSQEQYVMTADGLENITIPSIPHAQHKESVEDPKSRERRIEKFKETERTTQLEPRQVDVVSGDEYSDEGWQEASTRGRSAQMRRKSGSRKPALAKLVINNSSSRSSSYKSRMVLPQVKSSTTPTKTTPNGVPSEKLKQAKAPKTEARASGTTRLGVVASKTVSYKEVAISPPGTVLKPAVDQFEENLVPESNSSLETGKGENAALTQETAQEETSSDNSEKDTTLSEVEKPSSSSDETQEPESMKSTKKRSKLSASAPPFNPGSLLSTSHPYNSLAVGGLYDARIAHQTIVPQPIEIQSPQSVDTRVPCGPRSALYYRAGHTSRKRHGYPNGQNTVTGKNNTVPSAMNPHAAEFVPGKAWQHAEREETDILQPSKSQRSEPAITTTEEETSEPEKKTHVGKFSSDGDKSKQSLERAELARQILFKFIVKSVLNSSNDNEAEAEATIKMSEGDKSTGKQRQSNEKFKTNVHKSKKQDTEGFTVVSNKRKNKHQFTNTVPGLYSQQSVCTSVS